MFILCEKLSEDFQVPLINEFGYVSKFESELDANIERCYLQPEYENKLVVMGE